MTLEYFIREAKPEDIEDIYEIELESFKNPWTFDNYTNEFKIRYSHIIVAECKKRIIGFAVAWIVGDEIHLNKIAVSSRYRRSGIAKALIEYIIRMPGNDGKRIILLEVREKNIEARAFYKSLGFRESGLRKNYYPDDNAVLIEKVL